LEEEEAAVEHKHQRKETLGPDRPEDAHSCECKTEQLERPLTVQPKG
jgi:hypothetical protein